MSSRRGARPLTLALWATWLLAAPLPGCGARSGLEVGPKPPEGPECFRDEDCEGFGDLCKPVHCALFEEPTDTGVGGAAGASGAGGAAPVKKGGVCERLKEKDCDDGDVCTTDLCDPLTADCSYEPASLDSDGDGFRGPRAGTKVGDPDACGDDCNDASALAFPGGLEVCDGVDNDCNGVIDDGADFLPKDVEAVRISGDIAPAGPGGLAYSGKSWAALYSGTASGFAMYQSLISSEGEVLPPGETQVTIKNADASGGPIVWTGDRYGFAWQDRRNADYEVYFSLLDENGTRVLPDVRISDAPGFSVNVGLAWNGTEFILTWQDERSGPFRIYGQRVSVEGLPLGGNVNLSDDVAGMAQEAPSVAAGSSSIGVVFSNGGVGQQQIGFRVFNADLTPLSPFVPMTDGSTEAVYPVVVWNNDRYIVAWYDKTAFPAAIYAAAVTESGEFITLPKAITDPGNARSRYPFLRALGDRVLVLYSDDRDGNDGYEIYARTVTSLLQPLSPERRLTFAGRDSVYPTAAFGAQGDLGVLFRDDREGQHHVYFERLGCFVTDPPVP